MNETAYDKRKMRAFLLGSLPAEETELFDELSFTDDRFADQLNASEKDLVDDYARGALAGEELESFENHYLASPMRREKAEFANAFQTFAERKFAETNAAPFGEKPKRPFAQIFAGWNIFRRPDYSFQLGLVAATLLFMVLGGWLWLRNRGPDERLSETKGPREEIRQPVEESQKTPPTLQTEKAEKEPDTPRPLPDDNLNREKPTNESVLVAQKQPPGQATKQPDTKKKSPENSPPQTQPKQTPPVISAGSAQPSVEPRVRLASLILAPPIRGGEGRQLANLSISSATEFVDARLELEADEFPQYRVALVDLSNQTLWQSPEIKAEKSAAGKTLSLRFPAKNLKPQIYTLVVSGIGTNGAAEQISSYPFRVALN